ncbi:hypothetical protein F2Q68_00015069 [Brassica cretica]|uniref:Uncharacterized protein n=1 Tax=Brassica cretica TaxID=69181 RepID=A0A8S9HP23_BRACR|nr:hypothetical protein F2Q68_00015069 [Brassica cretica]
MELRLDPRPDDQTDRPGARLLRPTRHSKTNGQARINCKRAESDLVRNFSVLNHLARILHRSEDLGRAWSSLVHGTYPAHHTDTPTYVLLLTAVHTSGYIEPGQE